MASIQRDARVSSQLSPLATLGVSLWICALGGSGSAQTFTGLGFPTGASTSAARGVSADGSTVVGDTAAFTGSGFRWTQAGGMQSLGNFPSGTYSFAPGVSGDGAVVTGYGDTLAGQRAYRWTSAGGLVDIGTLSGALQMLGSSANADGSVLVGTGGSVGGYRAYRWTAASGVVSLGTLPGGTISFGYGVNGDGSVVVGDSDSTLGDVAFRWTSAGGMQSLGALPGGTFSYAYAVSADGLVVVGDSDSSGGDFAYRWTASTGMVSLGVPSVPFAYMVSNGVSADGSVIVGGIVGGSDTAFLWTSALGLMDLNAYLPSLGINLSGWTLTDAGGVSADGRVIAGTGIHNGVEEAWIATLPGTTGTIFCSGDGSGTACPCGNNGSAGRGCASSSFAAGAQLSASGFAGASAATDSLVLTASDVPGPGLFFQGTGQFGLGAGVPFGDGLLCAGGTITRLGVVFPSANSISYPGGLTPSPIHVAGGPLSAGDVRHYQCWYRDAVSFCTSSTFNLTPGLTIAWGA